jgi:hypothetical protein
MPPVSEAAKTKKQAYNKEYNKKQRMNGKKIKEEIKAKATKANKMEYDRNYQKNKYHEEKALKAEATDSVGDLPFSSVGFQSPSVTKTDLPESVQKLTRKSWDSLTTPYVSNFVRLVRLCNLRCTHYYASLLQHSLHRQQKAELLEDLQLIVDEETETGSIFKAAEADEKELFEEQRAAQQRVRENFDRINLLVSAGDMKRKVPRRKCPAAYPTRKK